MKPENKFSKSKLAADTWERINKLEETYKFKSYNGWAQVDGKGEEINRAYGEYECLLSITNDYDLVPF